MKHLRAILLVPVLFALLAGAALAKSPSSRARLDPSFGTRGTIAVGTGAGTPWAKGIPPVHLAVAPDGKSYLLQESVLIALDRNGKVDREFGENGGVHVGPPNGGLLWVSDLAVDPAGRILVLGAARPISGPDPIAPGNGAGTYGNEWVTQAFVARYLPDGSLDPTFGTGGTEITALGVPRPTSAPFGTPTGEYQLPILFPSFLSVDAQGRPVIGGEYLKALDGTCWDKRTFVARLTASGDADPSFGASGYVAVPGARAIGLTSAPGASWAFLGEAGPGACGGEDIGSYPSELSVLTETGAQSSELDPSRPPLVADGGHAIEAGLAVDSKGRIAYIERPATETSPPRVVRLRADGDLDTSFGQGGAVNLKHFGHRVTAIAVDRLGRVVVGFASRGFEMTRLSARGQIERRFGNQGLLQTPVARVGSVPLQALVIDPRQRILVAGAVASAALNAHVGVGIARFLPGN